MDSATLEDNEPHSPATAGDALAATSPGVAPTDRLRVPHRKRLSHTYQVSEEGGRELAIFYGVHEVSFDEERLFPFGEALLTQATFVAHSATSWGPGYDWEEIGPLLEALLEIGILRRDGEEDDPRGGGLVPSLLPPAECKVARTWSAAECEGITKDLGGRAVEVGYIESFVFPFRIAHSALDADGRQVGEANVYPSLLRIEQETEWRVCQYPGSRYRDEAPMNVTALKAMIKYWKPMMVTMLAVRSAVKERLPRSAEHWTVGDLHILANIVLTLPVYLLMRGGGTSPQKPLDPVLSSLFRITDGIRMATHEMLFMVLERGRLPDEPVTAAELYEFSESHGLFLAEAGVCAGPKALIEEFLSIACDGTYNEGLDGVTLSDEVQTLLAELPRAVDYGFYALQIWTVTRSVWLAMSKAYETLREVLGAPGLGEACQRVMARLVDDLHHLQIAQLSNEHERVVHLRAYVDAYEQAWLALPPGGTSTLEPLTAPLPAGPAHEEAARQLREILSQRFFGSGLDRAALERIVEALTLYLRAEQAILASATTLQRALNEFLDRPQPTRPLTVRDCRLAYSMRRDHLAGFPYLFDALEDTLGLAVECTKDQIDISDRRLGDAA
ncbi:MAG: hypothetical protein R3B48_30305 [Kofleriaceae bacterium]